MGTWTVRDIKRTWGVITTAASLVVALAGGGAYALSDRVEVGKRLTSVEKDAEKNAEGIEELKADLDEVDQKIEALQEEQRDFYRWMYERAGEMERAKELSAKDKDDDKDEE